MGFITGNKVRIYANDISGNIQQTRMQKHSSNKKAETFIRQEKHPT